MREEKRLQRKESADHAKKAQARGQKAIVTIDPNMVSPYTLMVLEDHKVLLREIGFDARKVQRRRGARGESDAMASPKKVREWHCTPVKQTQRAPLYKVILAQ